MFENPHDKIDQLNEIPLEHLRGQLLHNLILFGRILRGLGVELNPGSMIELSKALGYIDMWHKADFYYTLRSLLLTRQSDLEKFNEAFELFWRKPKGQQIDFSLQQMLQQNDKTASEETIIVPPSFDPNQDEEDNGEEDEAEAQEIIELTQTYSNIEILKEKDFGELNKEEMHQIKHLISQLIWKLGEKETRRQRPGRRSNRPDFRRTLRKNFRYGGELIDWSYREPKIKPRPLIIIADISGSMESYTRLLIHFLYSLAEGMSQKVEIFTFSTRLTRITRQLKNKDIDRAITDVTSAVNDWSGGTRIGAALKTFNYDWSRRVLRGGAIVMLISDGWDRGDPQLLGREMSRLHRLSHRTVWLNPLLGMDSYEPLTRGMQAALPFIDDFLPVHNLNSLEELAQHLRALDNGRQSRQQKTKLRGSAFTKRF